MLTLSTLTLNEGWCVMNKRIALPLLLMILLAGSTARAQSLDLAVNEFGLSIGNSPRFSGLRINAVDDGVERIRGLNLTLWTPGQNPSAAYEGLALGLIGTKARRIDGIALSGIGVNASERIRGIAAGALGVGTAELDGLAAGLILVDVKQRLRGIVFAGGWTGQAEQLDGIALSAGSAWAKNLRGIAVGGFLAGGEKSLSGIGLGGFGFYSHHLKGIGFGGLGGGGETLQGIVATGLGLGCGELQGVAASLGVVGGKSLDGIVLSGLGHGAAERIRGVAVGSLVSFAPETTGLTVGALNGLYIDRIDLEDFLHFNLVNQRFTGIQIGLVNYTANLKGLQIGLMNYAGNNPRGLRLLPLVNLHL